MLQRVICWLAGVVLFFLPLAAEASDLQQLRVGYIESPGFFQKNANGNYSGSIFEYVEIVSSFAGLEPVYQRITPAAAVDELENGRVDVVAGVIVPNDFDASRYTIINRYSCMTPIYLARLYDVSMDGHRPRIGYYAPVYETMIEYFQLQNGSPLDGMELIPYRDWERFYDDYYRGKTDGYLTSSYALDSTVPMERILFNSNIYLVVKKGNSALEEKLSDAIINVMRIKPDFRSELAKHEAATLRPLVINREEREYLRNRPVIRMGSSGQQVPFTYFENGQARGILWDILNLMEIDLGVQFEVVQARNNTELMEMFRNGQIDVIPAFGRDYNRAGELNARLTPAYFSFDHVPVTRLYEELPDTPRVACPRQYFFVKDFVEAHYEPEQIVWFDSFPACFEAVSQKKADLLFAKSLSVQNELQTGNFTNLHTNGQIAASQSMCMAVRQDADPRLFALLSKEVAYMDKTRVSGIVNQYMAEINAHRSWRTFLNENPLRAVEIVLGISVLVIGALVYIINLRRKTERQLFDAAYRNPMTGIHTMSWFEKYVPGLIGKNHAKARRSGELFLMNLASYRFDLLKATYEQSVLYGGIKKLVADVREKNDWLLYDAISSELAQMYIVCRKVEGMSMLEAAERIMQDAFEIRGDSVSIRMSYRIGLCQIPPEGGLNLPLLMTNAAIAREEAEIHGEAVGIYDESLQNRRVLEKKIEDIMYKALEEEEFQVWLQPKYDLTTRRVIGAESLVRWQSPELGFLMPYQFINLFEQNGFIIPFDYYMLEHVCRLQQRFLSEGKPIAPIAVNQSGLHIRETNYVERMREITEFYGLPKGAVELELTETAFIDYDTKEESGNATSIVAALREMGYAIAMDDFCTGYSSIAMLHRLPLDVMKIDRAMLLASENSSRGQKILKNVVNFGESLDMLVLCEGIETESQEQMLLKNGCRYGQGFLYARPMPEDQYAAFIEAHGIEEHGCALKH